MEHNQQVDALNELITINLDGIEGYSTAAEEVSNEELQTIFNRLSQQRRGFVEELKNEVLSLGGEPSEHRNIEGFLHNNWLKVRSLIASGDEETTLNTCQTGEEYAADKYSEIISNSRIPSYLRDRIVKQHDLIKGAHNQLESLKNEFVD